MHLYESAGISNVGQIKNQSYRRRSLRFRVLAAIAIGGAGVAGALQAHASGDGTASAEFLASSRVTSEGGTYTDNPDAMPSPKVSRQELEDFAQKLAKDTGHAFEDQLQGLLDSDAIGAFVNEHWKSTNVGAVWVEFEGGYSVHARVNDGGDEREFDPLHDALDSPIIMHYGGASLGELNAISDAAADEPFLYQLDLKKGFVEVPEGDALPRALASSKYVREVPWDREPITPQAVHPGQKLRYWTGSSYLPECTVGFTWEITSSYQGFATAAHCADGHYQSFGDSNITQSQSYQPFQLISENCTNQDVQLQRVQNIWSGANSSLFQIGYGSYSAFHIAQAYWIGQASERWGMTTGGTGGNVVGFGISNRSGSGDCPPGTVNGIQLDHPGASGDSGGPMFVWSQGTRYLAGVYSGSNGVMGSGTWIPYITLPTAVILCSAANSC